MSQKPTVSLIAPLLPSKEHLVEKWGLPTLPLLLFTLILTLPLSLFSDNSLSEKSPFLPPGHGSKPKEAEPAVQPQGPISREIEFRGIIKMGGVYQFSVTNKKDQKSYWLKENEGQAGISVSNYDPNSSSIVVLMNGRSERLTLMSASETPMPVAQAKPATPNTARTAVLPPQLTNINTGSANNRKVVPRRRVILPKKTN